ncbi:MAG: TIGR03905 family TSCPD domain-containing protein [Bacteroidales bacterium]|nr:TIGR03905 family TSCPD domain-containing protein [Candidatus Liminaster caballi]
MKEINYQTQGTCSKLIHVELDDQNIIQNAYFIGGCNGNLQGVCALIKGQKAEDVIARVKGISCNGRPTSCPDQLACALAQAIAK